MIFWFCIIDSCCHISVIFNLRFAKPHIFSKLFIDAQESPCAIILRQMVSLIFFKWAIEFENYDWHILQYIVREIFFVVLFPFSFFCDGHPRNHLQILDFWLKKNIIFLNTISTKDIILGHNILISRKQLFWKRCRHSKSVYFILIRIQDFLLI